MTFISDINPATPGAGDAAGFGDDEIRKLKQDIKDTIGGLDAQVTEPDVDPNPPKPLTAATMSSWEARIQALEGSVGGTGLIPVGMIAIWAVDLPVPAGWVECNGQISGNPFLPIPDLRGYTVAGTGASQSSSKIGINLNATKGSTTPSTNQNGKHSHSVVVGAHALTIDEIPTADANVQSGGGQTVQKAGTADAHTHPGSSAADAGLHSHTIQDNTPPCYGVKFIIYTGV